MKFALFFLILIFARAEIYEDLESFAYSKKPNVNLSLKKAEILSLKKDKKPCVEILISQERVQILEFFETCAYLKDDKNFDEFLQNAFFTLYNDEKLSEFVNAKMHEIKLIMQDFMIYYKLHLSFNKDLRKISKNENLHFLNEFDEKNRGVVLLDINNQPCVSFEFIKKNEKLAFEIKGLENNNLNCHKLINSASFKELSFNKQNFNAYFLD